MVLVHRHFLKPRNVSCHCIKALFIVKLTYMKRVNLPQNSILRFDKSFEFIDAFEANFNDKNNEINIFEITRMFFNSDPKWIEKIFLLRNKIVKSFGLKIPESIKNRKEKIQNLKFEINEQIGIFKVFNITENEIILGEDDKHLDFRVSLYLGKENIETKSLTISTNVKFNNSFGKIYFIPVKPFHKIIVPTMLKGILKQIEDKRNCNDS